MARYDDAGESLIEVLIAVAVLGLAGITVLGMIATDVTGSAQHRSQATGVTVLSRAAEYVKTTGFQTACGTITPPAPASPYTVAASAPVDASSGGACNPATTVLQRFTLTVSRSGTAVKSVDVVVRNKT
jgi:Tfp pilus assembly protein PilV